jgi:V8-like Glu-specific endopeptidase
MNPSKASAFVLGLLPSIALLPALALAEGPERRILGDDERQEFRESGSPWQSIGRLHGRKNRFRSVNCSGALVAPRVVLSAGHCLSDDVDEGRIPSTLELEFTLPDGRSSKAVAFRIGGIPRGATDWALVVLNDELGLDSLGQPAHFSMASPSDPSLLVDTKIRVIGYSSAFQEGLQRAEARGRIGQVRADGLFDHDADTTTGISGAPIIELRSQKDEEFPRILGVHTASDADDDPSPLKNYGVSLGMAALALEELLQSR